MSNQENLEEWKEKGVRVEVLLKVPHRDEIGGEVYTYQLSDVEEVTNAETFHPEITILADEQIVEQKQTPLRYALYGAYPNPFNPRTTFKFDLPLIS